MPTCRPLVPAPVPPRPRAASAPPRPRWSAPARRLAALAPTLAFAVACATGTGADPACEASVQQAQDQGYADGFAAGQGECGEVAVADLTDRSKQEEWLKLPCLRLVGEIEPSGPPLVSMAATQEETPAVKQARKAAKDAGGREVSAKVDMKKKAAKSIEGAARSALLSKAQFLGFTRVVEAIVRVDCGSANCTAEASGVAIK